MLLYQLLVEKTKFIIIIYLSKYDDLMLFDF